MVTINILWRDVASSNGKTYKIRYTTDFGYNLTISTKLKASRDEKGYYITYDPAKAYVKMDKSGYMILFIED